MATTRTPYTDTNLQRRVVNEMISLMEWTSAPIIKLLGLENEKRFRFTDWPPGNAKKVEWLEDTLAPKEDALDGAIDASQTQFLVDHGTYFQEGHVIEIDSEAMWVASITGNTLTVSRGYAGTTPATHSDNAVIYLQTIAKKTGANYALSYTTTTTNLYNYCQNIETSVRVNGDQESTNQYGYTDEMAYHIAKKIGGSTQVGEKGKSGELIQALARTFYRSLRQQPSETVAGSMGGLPTYVTTNVVGDTSTALDKPTIHTQLRNIYNAGGEPTHLITSPWGAEKITQMYEGLVRTERSEERGGSSIMYITTPVKADLMVEIDWMCPTTKTYIIDKEKVGWCTVRPFAPKDMPSLGDYMVKSILGEYTFVVENEKSHAIITHSNSL